ncbi:MAG TPA: AAA family ATPase [Thermoleophilia bacterium]|nr:AAA family ATPase [Thermoleophilia bacterium]
MSVPRLILAGVEPGPALDLVAGALLSGCGEQHATRAILLGFDLPLWRLVYDVAARAPRALDPVLHSAPVADELFDQWSERMDLALVIGVRPLLDRWEGVNGSRAADLARRLDAPIVLVLDARGRGASAAAAIYGTRALAAQLEIGGVILVGGDDSPAGLELQESLRRDVGLPVLGHIPPQLTEQFLRQYAVASGSVRTLGGARAPETTLVQLCREAATYLQLDELMAVAARRGFLPSAPRRLLLPETSATDLVVAVAWGPPLQPVMLENVDVLQAMGVNLVPLNVSRDRELPEPCDGLLFTGTLDEQSINAFSDNALLRQNLRTAATDGLPVMALGGGALLMLQRLADSRGRSHDLLGLVPAEAELLEWYDRPRYVRAEATRANPYDTGEVTLHELFDLEFLVLEQDVFAYQVAMPDGSSRTEGFVVGRCLATTLFASFAASPGMAGRFIAAMNAARHS